MQIGDGLIGVLEGVLRGVADRLEILAQVLCGRERRIDARQRIADAAVGILADPSGFAEQALAQRGGLALGAYEKVVARVGDLVNEIVPPGGNFAGQRRARGIDLARNGGHCAGSGADQNHGTHHEPRQRRQQGANANLLQRFHGKANLPGGRGGPPKIRRILQAAEGCRPVQPSSAFRVADAGSKLSELTY